MYAIRSYYGYSEHVPGGYLRGISDCSAEVEADAYLGQAGHRVDRDVAKAGHRSDPQGLRRAWCFSVAHIDPGGQGDQVGRCIEIQRKTWKFFARMRYLGVPGKREVPFAAAFAVV